MIMFVLHFRDCKAHKGFKVHKEVLGLKDRMASKAPKVFKAHKAVLDNRASKEHRAHGVIKEFKEFKGHKEIR